MISRRILRTKVLQTIYSHYQSGDADIAKSEKELFKSINKTYDLYFFLLLLGINVVDYASKQIDLAKQKFCPSEDELNPNYKFVNNKIISQLRDNNNLQNHISACGFSWLDNPELIKRLYKELTATEEFKTYMASSDTSYDADKKLLIFFYESVLCDCELLYQILEEKSIYWIDSVEFVIGMVVRTIGKFKIGYDSSYPLQKLYKSEDDRTFVAKLFRGTIAHNDAYRQLISSNTKNWDVERIAFIDILIMEIAISEIMEFPEIPIKVTFNEYIEIAKNYSTAKSCVFINGVLDKIVHDLRLQGKINKIADIESEIENK